MNECGILGQKLGYDRCPYLSFFVRRFEDEIFDLTSWRDLNTKYTIFYLRCHEMLVKCSWCNYECRTANMIWLGIETTIEYLNSFEERDLTMLRVSVVSVGKIIVYYHIDSCMKTKNCLVTPLDQTTGDDTCEKTKRWLWVVCLLELVTLYLIKGSCKPFVC